MNANVEGESTGGGLDTVKWIIVVAILASTVVANDYFSDVSVLIRAGGFVVAVGIAMLLAAQTDKGRNFMVFARESRTEVRKVVWPNRQEATHTTLIIAGATLVVALLLYFLDMGLRWLIGLFTGIGG